MKWEEIDNDIISFEKDCLSVLRDMETKELKSEEKQGDIEKENANLLKEIEELENENSALKLELSGILSINENLKKTSEELQKNVSKSEFLCLNLRSGMEMCENDSVRMKKANEMLQIGKEFTRVRWDYSTPPNICKGYFSNKEKKTLESFELDREKVSEDEIQKFLWERIEANSGAVWADLVSLSDSDVIENKENVHEN